MTNPTSTARVRRHREKQRAMAHAAAAERATRQEANDEHLAPAIMRGAVLSPPRYAPDRVVFNGKGNGVSVTHGEMTDPGGRMLIGPRVQIVNGRATRGCPIEASKQFTAEQKRAARQLQLDWQDVGAGIGVGAVDYLRSGGGSGEGGHAAMMEQIAARGRLEGAMAWCGALAPAIARVVLDGVPLSVFVLELPPDDDGNARTMVFATAWIGLGLDKLSSFYHPPVEARGVRIRTFGPARREYSTAAVG